MDRCPLGKKVGGEAVRTIGGIGSRSMPLVPVSPSPGTCAMFIDVC